MDDPQRFSCPICGQWLKYKYSLERHVNVVHGGRRPFSCECGKVFATQEQLSRHFHSKHSDKKPYACQKGCERSFASYTARVYHHEAVHDLIKYSCPVEGCSKTYTTRIHLQNHIRLQHVLQVPLLFLIFEIP